ncbi:MAG: LysR family transcriptional regulator [Dorea sp.]|jgi:DNA-binding transcriptional LysR family regulator|nr:LysR family transcriptional regulator [Dorea sp.]
MNLYHLRYFVTLAHLEHYTKAAEILTITQPSLSHAISSLEKELGVKLFEKDGRNIVLTKCGQTFLTDIEQSLDKLDSSVKRLRLAGLGEGRIDIGMLRILGDTVPKYVKRFMDIHSSKNIQFYFHTSTNLTADIIRDLKDRRYDIAFCSKTENEPSIDFVPVDRQELVLIVPNSHPLATHDTVDLRETLPYPQICFSHHSGLRPVIDKLFEQCGGAPKADYFLEEEQAIAGLVSAGLGIAVVPRMSILDHMPVKIIEITEPAWERVIYMAVLKNVYQAPVVQNLKAYIIENTNLHT